jgi:hypothetical protein
MAQVGNIHQYFMISDFPNLFLSDCFINSHFITDISLELEMLSHGLEGLVVMSRTAPSKATAFTCPLWYYQFHLPLVVSDFRVLSISVGLRRVALHLRIFFSCPVTCVVVLVSSDLPDNSSLSSHWRCTMNCSAQAWCHMTFQSPLTCGSFFNTEMVKYILAIDCEMCKGNSLFDSVISIVRFSYLLNLCELVISPISLLCSEIFTIHLVLHHMKKWLLDESCHSMLLLKISFW